MNAHLVAYANASKSKSVKEHAIFVPTEKGLHIVDQYILSKGVLDNDFRRFASTQTVCPKLMHLERDAEDRMILPNDAIYSIFRWFSGHLRGSHPGHASVDTFRTSSYHGHPEGIAVRDSGDEGQSNRGHPEYHFSVVAALDCLCDFTSVRGHDDAAIISAHFERCGFIRMVSNTSQKKDPSIMLFVRGSSPRDSNITVSFHSWATTISRSKV